MESHIINVIDYNYEERKLILNQEFLVKLRNLDLKRLVVITVNGQVGKGKSTFGSLLVSVIKWLENNIDDDIFEACIFETSDASKSYTMGMNAFSEFVVINDSGIVVIDMEGLNGVMDGVSPEELEVKLAKLLSVSLLISSVFVYISPLRLESCDAEALKNVQTHVEILKEKTKIDYPNIYFIISKTNRLVMEDAVSNAGNNSQKKLYYNTNYDTCNGNNEVVVTEEQQKALLDLLTHVAKLNPGLKEKFNSNVFPQIDTSKGINLKNPKGILLQKDRTMFDHLQSLVHKFLLFPKTHPGTTDLMTGPELADYIEKVVMAVNADKFDVLSVSHSNTLINLKKSFTEEIEKELNDIYLSKINPNTVVQDSKLFKEAIDYYDESTKRYLKTKKKAIKKKMEEKIKLPEEIHSFLIEIKKFINEIKNKIKKELLKNYYNSNKEALCKDLGTYKKENEEKLRRYESTKQNMETERVSYEKNKIMLEKEVKELEEEIDENLERKRVLQQDNEIKQSKLYEIAHSEELHKYNEEEWGTLKARYEKLRGKCDGLDEKIRDLNEKKQEKEMELSLNKSKLEEKKKENSQDMRQIKELETSLSTLRNENQNLENKISKLQEEIENLNLDVDEARKKKSDLDKKIEEFNQKLEEVEDEKLEQETKKMELSQKYDLNKVTINPTDQVIKKMQMEYEKTDLEENIKKLEDELKEMKDNFKEYKEKYNMCSQSELQAKLEQTEKKHQEIIKGDLDQAVKNHEQEITNLKYQYLRLEGEIKENQEEIERKKEMIKNKHEIISSKSKLMLEAYRQEEIEKEGQRVAEELRAKKAEKINFERKLQEMKDKLRILEIEKETSAAEVKRFEEEYKRVETAKNKISIENVKEMEKVNERLEAVISKLQEIKPSYEELTQFTKLVNDYIKHFQGLFTKFNSIINDKTVKQESSDQIVTLFFESFPEKVKFLNSVNKLKTGYNLENEVNNFLSSLENLESHHFFKNGKVDNLPSYADFDSFSLSLDSSKIDLKNSH